MSKSLTSIPTLVESPFIIATVGGVTFGSYSGSKNSYGNLNNVIYPNFMRSIQIVKVNGTVNTYTLTFSYAVRSGQDPNLLDKIFSRAAKDRKITLQYGDWNSPSDIYKEEVCIITNITCNLNMNSATIDYVLTCTSDAIGLTSTTYNFVGKEAKPSDVFMDLLRSKKYGLTKVFTGMKDMENVLRNNLITSNDKKVKLLPQNNVDVLSYMSYLTDCMINDSNVGNNAITNSKYFLTVYDDIKNNVGGTYFKVSEVTNNTKSVNSIDTYEIDVNYPTDNFVTDFRINNDQSWAILYEFNEAVKQESYSYYIDDNGAMSTRYMPSNLVSTKGEISAAKSSWWTQMTQFPIKASITIKGLTRPSILMTYVRLNVVFNGGMKHISSGLYIITKQTDTIDSSGYRTTLELVRVGEDA